MPGSAARLPGAAAERRLASGAPLVAAFQKGKELPTKDRPAAGPRARPDRDGAGTAGPGDEPTTPGSSPSTSRCPRRGGQPGPRRRHRGRLGAYDVAFALVWAEGDEVLNVNEAHAYASCSDCVAVAVAFQVVLIMDDAQVVVPQNLAVAANYDCYRCITAAIASQLVLSVQEEPGEEELRALGAVWNRLPQFAQHDHVLHPHARSPHSSRPSRPRSSPSSGTRHASSPSQGARPCRLPRRAPAPPDRRSRPRPALRRRKARPQPRL